MKLSTLLATLILGLAAGPALATPHTSFNQQNFAGKGNDNCPYKTALSRNEDRARAEMIAENLTPTPRSNRSRSRSSQTIRN